MKLAITLGLGLAVLGCGGGSGGNNNDVCGDGLVEPSEQCDDGNRSSGDGCSAACNVEECGNAITDVDEECDDGNTIDDDACSNTCQMNAIPTATITAQWTLRDLATNTVTGCPVGFDTAAVHSQALDAGGNPVGAPIIDLFDCSASTGDVLLDPDVYEVFVQIENTNGSQIYAQSLAAAVDVTTTDKTFSATILNDGGYFAFAWELRDAQNNGLLTCAQAGNPAAIEIVSTVTGGSTAVADQFNCEDGQGVTAGLLAGSYTTSIAALNAQNQALGAPQNAANRIIGDRNAVTNLGTVTLPID